jgi:hypothetical protein
MTERGGIRATRGRGENMSNEDDTEAGATFFLAPGSGYAICELHEAEAARHGAEFRNYGWATDDNGICSKTTKGYLTTVMEGHEVRHVWEDY